MRTYIYIHEYTHTYTHNYTSCSMVAAATVGHILSTVTGTVSRYMELKAKSSAIKITTAQ